MGVTGFNATAVVATGTGVTGVASEVLDVSVEVVVDGVGVVVVTLSLK